LYIEGFLAKMPQINFYTYLSQTSWTIFLFFFFFFFMKQFILPLLFEKIKIKNLLFSSLASSEASIKNFKGKNFYNILD